ncbi:hypothetical protein [Caudoviricetes sp.]|nr:hypothetical protein [Caudoviricetes sp.]
MGGFTAQVQQPQTSQPIESSGKGGPSVTKPIEQVSAPKDMTAQDGSPPQPIGKGGNYQTSATSGQPRAGMPNQYSNTVGQWDNTQQQSQQPQGGGKGKGR